jgi:CHAP domain
MFVRFSLLVCLSFLVAACSTKFSTPYATGHYAARPVQCVPFARNASGIQLYGDAHTWWDQAGTKYYRGPYPEVGSVLVLARTARMTHGHLAVVKRVLTNRQIQVTHSNWGSDWRTRRIIYESVLAEDVSPENNWTQVKFWNHVCQCFGFPYQALGFISK